MSRYGRRKLHELYYYLKLTRRLEEELARLHREQRIPGPLYLGAGEEAVAVGAAYPLEPGDIISSSLPSVGSLVARGIPPAFVVAHIMGKDAAPANGRDRTVHLGDLEKGLVPPGGHLATHLGVMAGVALAVKHLGKKSVAVILVSERAVATGDFHEGLNFAAVHQLPLVVVVENGPKTAGVSPAQQPYFYERTRGYGVPSLPVDGVDILQVLQVTETAAQRARLGKGPTLVEARTTLRSPHRFREEAPPVPFEPNGRGEGSVSAGSGEGAASSAGEIAAGQEEQSASDPVAQFETFLVEHGLLQPVEKGLILDRIERLVDDAIQCGDADPFPDARRQRERVYQPEPPVTDVV